MMHCIKPFKKYNVVKYISIRLFNRIFPAEPNDSEQESYQEFQSTDPNETQRYVFVEDIASKRKRLISIKKGENLPPGHTLASVTGDLPFLPDELGDLPAETLPIIRNMVFGSNATFPLPTRLISTSFTGTSSSSPSTNTHTPAAAPRSAPPQPPKPKVPSNPNRLNSLSDLMTSEMQKKSTGRLKYKHKSINPVKLQTIISNPAHFTPAEPEFSQGFEIERPSLNIIKLASGSSTSSSSSSNVRSPPYQKPSLSVIPLSAKSSKGMILLGCKICGEVFPCHEDNLFRRHIFIKHDIEIVDDKYFEDSKIQSDKLLRCRKCKVVVLNKCEEHQLLCLPGLTKEAAFEELPINALNWPRKVSHLCGLCGKGFSMRFELRNHTIKEHKTLANKMIFDPHFRCVRCLLRFDESYTLGKHCQGCVEVRPRKETVLELAKCLSYCDFCGNSHTGLSESTSCYLNKGIFRCVLCLVTSRDKSHFYRHLHLYHGLTLQQQPKLLIDCPICDFGPDKYTVIFPHVVTEHYAPLLLSNGNGQGQLQPRPASSSTPSSTQAAKFTAQQKPTQVGTGTASNVTTSVSTSIFASVRAPSPQGVKKIPELRPLAPKPKAATATTNAPPGVVINTNRISHPIRMAGGNLSAIGNSSTATGQPPTSASQMFTSHRSPIILNPQALASHIITNSSSRTPGGQASAPRPIILQPNTLANLSSSSPAVRLPMSSLFRPATTRPTGLVRPQPTGAVTMVRPSTTTTPANPRIPTTMPAILSAVSLVPSNTSSVVTLNGLPVSLVSTYASNGMPVGGRGVRPHVNVQRPMGTTTVTSATATTPTPVRLSVMSERPPIARPLVLGTGTTTSTAATPAVVRTSSAASVRQPVIIRLPKTSITTASAILGSDSASTATNAVSTNKNIVTPVTQSNSRVILIDGQSMECGYKQDSLAEQTRSNSNSAKKVIYIAKIASTSGSMPPIQSRSGFTTVRYPVPNNPLRMPNLPSAISVRPVTPSSATTSSTSTTNTTSQSKSVGTPQPPVTKS